MDDVVDSGTAKLSTVYHEAAHAVAGMVLEIPFDTITIQPSGNLAGCVVFNNPIYGADLDRLSPKEIVILERAVVVYLAGYFGGLLVTGNKKYEALGAKFDIRDAVDRADTLAKQPASYRDIDGHIGYGYMRAYELVGCCDPMIKTVVRALLAPRQGGQGTMTYAQVLTVIDKPLLRKARRQLRLFWD